LKGTFMRTITRIGAASAAVLLAGGAAVFSASAANAAESSATGADATVNGGVLAISAPASVTFPAVNPGTTSQATIDGITVDDTRAGTIGWTASVSVTEFVSATEVSRTIAADKVTYTPSTPTTTGTVTVTKSGTVTGTADGTAVQTASAVTGNNSATWSANLDLLVPSNALAANDYQATITHSVL
jgi:hypothetical protein